MAADLVIHAANAVADFTIGYTGSGSLLLTSLGDNADSFRLDLDANGDGTIDPAQIKTFDALVARC